MWLIKLKALSKRAGIGASCTATCVIEVHLKSVVVCRGKWGQLCLEILHTVPLLQPQKAPGGCRAKQGEEGSRITAANCCSLLQCEPSATASCAPGAQIRGMWMFWGLLEAQGGSWGGRMAQWLRRNENSPPCWQHWVCNGK